MADKPPTKSPSRFRDKFRRSLRVDRDTSSIDGALAQQRFGVDGLDLEEARKSLDELEQNSRELMAVLDRCRDLAVKACDESISLADRVQLQSEADSLMERYNKLLHSTDFSVRYRIEQSLNKNAN